MAYIPALARAAILGCFLLVRPATAQNPADEVRAVVTGLFEAMRTADGARAAALFHSDARLLSVAERDGQPVLSTTPAGDFVRAIGAPRTEVWNERISGLEIRVAGNMATAWMNYGFFLDERFSHCGVNAFQLFRDPSGWQIVQITDTRRQQGCDEWG